MLLVVGLGNPGREYAAHRHNVGFMAVDALAERVKAEPFREKFAGEWARAEIASEPAILLKPMTYMNDSGRSVQPAMAFFKIAPRDVVVLHDELDLPFADLRLKQGGGHAGHNGLRSLIEHIGGPDFGRVRIGVGRPPPEHRGDVASFVLSGFTAEERVALPDLVKAAGSAVMDVARRGFGPAMNAQNARSKPKPKPEKPVRAAPSSEARAPAAPDPEKPKG